MNRLKVFKLLFITISLSLCLVGSILSVVEFQKVSSQTRTSFLIGERLTYNISFASFDNAAYAEIYVVSNGKLEGKEAIELSAKLKSDGFVSAAFYLLDETRSTFVSNETGLPFYVRSVTRASGLPKERIDNFLKAPTTHYDLLSLIYKVRNSGGAGSFSVQDNNKVYNFDFAATGGEIVKSADGEFETTISTVQSSYLTDLSITNFRVNFTNDERRIPVQIRFNTPKGKFKALIASIQNLEPTPTPETTETASPVVTVTRTPKPVPTATPYIINQGLSEDIPFGLGETLEFRISQANQNIGTVVLQATERKEFDDQDSLLLQAQVTEVGQGAKILDLDNIVQTQVEPYTLMPLFNKIDLKSSFSIFNQVADFDQELGEITFDNGKKANVPVGTHSVLSLAYAIRSFNLKPSLDPKNPVNDTRVAVLLGEKAYVLTLRPQFAKIITLKGENVSAQLITIRTGNRSIDDLNLRLWLSNDSKRVPLRFAIGTYQADLVSEKIVRPQK